MSQKSTSIENDIEKVFMSIQLSKLPPNCTKEFLDCLFINECFHIGIDLLPNGTAELVLPNIHDAVDVLYPCFFV